MSNTARRPPQDFGVQLTNTTIESCLADQRLLQADYRRRFANDFAILRELVANVLNHDHGKPVLRFQTRLIGIGLFHWERRESYLRGSELIAITPQ